ncbi:carbohydrate ABC transporter permease [Cohnella sp. REN36]|uniref:carbohydrate ABC transporter permease n=1 Tax=Cohnella sp. REN36 TaxID=2887347 RepID=UPI001D154181|nr:sugar ABC transporter permease [Cohnella sp. REN36]MCC3372438.1 sugar ABC transporter permease [Cohnella sp. REN36]
MRIAKKSAFVFALPGILIYFVFMVVPILLCFYYSFTNWDGISDHYRFNGIKNFTELASDDTFLDALKYTAIFTLITALIYNVFGILIAVILDKKSKVHNFAKSTVFLPVVLSSVVVSFIWSYMTQMDGGIINLVVNAFGLPSIHFYGSKMAILYTVSVAVTWAGLGYFTMVYMAALKTIPEELYEASTIDGAGKTSKFFRITLPLLAPGITINTVLSIVWGFKQYDHMKIMTPGTVQSITMNSIERAFNYNMFSYASAIILVLFVIVIVISVIQLGIMKRFEVSEG